jgi:hypothetical protein
MTTPAPTVEVHLPPDLVNKLAPQHGWADWFYISGATLIGAAVALLAAFIAWRAIRKQIDANAAQVHKQIGGLRPMVDQLAGAGLPPPTDA